MKKMTRFALQLVAIVTMTIDHAGKMFLTYGTFAYDTCFIIGRIAFPLFCFMLAEGARHTRNIWKYFGRILLFATLFEGVFFIFSYFIGGVIKVTLNIFYTMALGILILALLRHKKSYIKILSILPIMLLIFTNIIVRSVQIGHVNFPLDFEYSFYGIFIIIWFGIFDKRWIQVMGLVLSTVLFCQNGLFYTLGYKELILDFYYQWFGLLAIPFILLYNGEKGKIQFPRYFLYFYYPIHMVAIYGIYILIHMF